MADKSRREIIDEGYKGNGVYVLSLTTIKALKPIDRVRYWMRGSIQDIIDIIIIEWPIFCGHEFYIVLFYFDSQKRLNLTNKIISKTKCQFIEREEEKDNRKNKKDDNNSRDNDEENKEENNSKSGKSKPILVKPKIRNFNNEDYPDFIGMPKLIYKCDGPFCGVYFSRKMKRCKYCKYSCINIIDENTIIDSNDSNDSTSSRSSSYSDRD